MSNDNMRNNEFKVIPENIWSFMACLPESNSTAKKVLEAAGTKVLLGFAHQHLPPPSSTSDYNAMEILHTRPKIQSLF